MAFKCRHKLLASAARSEVPFRTWLGPPEVALCALSQLNPQMTYIWSLVDVGKERPVVIVKDEEPGHRRRAALTASGICLFWAILSAEKVNGSQDRALACLIRTDESDEILTDVERLLSGKPAIVVQLHLDQAHGLIPSRCPTSRGQHIHVVNLRGE